MAELSRAEAIVANAEKEVAQMLEQTDKEAQAWVNQGIEDGQKQGQEQAKQLLEKLSKLDELMSEELPKGIVRAALFVAQEMLHAERTAEPQIVVQVAQTALKSATEASRVSIRANSDDLAILQSQKRQLVDVLEKATDIDLRSDRQVERGGVLIHTEAGVIDAQLKTQLSEIARILGI